MSPTSLANRNLKQQSKGRRQFSRVNIPIHRRFITLFKELPRRTRNVILILIVFFLIWKVLSLWSSPIKFKTSPPIIASPTKSINQQSQNNNNQIPPIPTPSSKHLRFAPTQVKKTSVRIHFVNGKTQEIYATSSQREGDDEEIIGARSTLWESVDVESIAIPIGGVLEVKYEKGSRKGSISRGKGDDCSSEVCEGIESVLLSQDVLLGLNQMMAADQSEFMILTIPSRRNFPLESVTLVTQFTISRLPRFERMLKEWKGPLSISIYLTDYEDIDLLIQYLSLDDSILQKFKSLALTIVKPDYTISEEALRLRLRYPINQLRNLALSNAPTSYVLVTDVDFVPSPNMHSILSNTGVPLIQFPVVPYKSPTMKTTAVVVSAFILSSAHQGPFPETSKALEELLLFHPPLATLTDPNAGHGPSQPSLLFSSSSLVSSSSSFEICFEPQWEPYYLLHKSSHPLYDERFTDQGGDKQSHSLLLNVLGYKFIMLREVWFLHPSKNLEGSEEDWPSKRLVVHHEAESEGEGEDGGEGGGGRIVLKGKIDSNHFSIGQRDFNRFRYFQNFLPELEKTWGKQFRFPRGCSATLLGWRLFGKARAGTVFGL